MEIKDYFPVYPDLDDEEFQAKLFAQEELYEYKYDGREQNDLGQLYPHQRILQRVFSPYTLYNVCLLKHDAGTGKTCLANAIAEHMRRYRLKNMTDVKKIKRQQIPTNLISQRKQYNYKKKAYVLTPNSDLIENTRNIYSNICSIDHVIKDKYNIPTKDKNGKIIKLGEYVAHYYLDKEGIEEKEHTYITRRNKLLRQYYSFHTHEDFINEISRKSFADWIRIFSNCVFIVIFSILYFLFNSLFILFFKFIIFLFE